MPSKTEIEQALNVLVETMQNAFMDDEDSASLRINSDGQIHFAVGLEDHVLVTPIGLATLLSE